MNHGGGIFQEMIHNPEFGRKGVRHFEEFMVPRYRNVVKVLEEYGVKIHFLDCDGDISALVPG